MFVVYLINMFCFSQQKLKKITISDGLSLNFIKLIFVDTEQYLYFGSSNELNGTINWLISDGSSFVTGTTIPIDGGFSAFSGV